VSAIPPPVEWCGDSVRILDQRALPHREEFLDCRTVEDLADAIRSLAVRGAPVIGIAAAFGIALVAARSRARGTNALFRELARAGDALVATRPTAVNLRWAVARMLTAAREECCRVGGTLLRVHEALVAEALRIQAEDREACAVMGRLGAELVPERANILTHCNTGRLCTAGIGTALGVVTTAHERGAGVHVWVDETRPVLQGARLTAWELSRLGVPMTLVADDAAASLMAAGRVDLVLVGADRIARNGDVANKVGTYGLAVLARHHRVPFYVVAPTSTVDLDTPSGRQIQIEERDPQELTRPLGLQVAPEGVRALNPAFDITPAELVTAIVTERGILRPPFTSALARAVSGASGRGRAGGGPLGSLGRGREP
jgi:methylthioribose-1-phosphate isomerase